MRINSSVHILKLQTLKICYHSLGQKVCIAQGNEQGQYLSDVYVNHMP